ncbi:MAG: IS66 family insertion sequence element accessory protein TnpB [Myxococcota bacterium]
MRVRRELVIRYAVEPVDFRKSIDGLAMAVGQALERDPMNGEVFVFRNRRRTALKALYWTKNGFVMLYKRLEKGRFTLPAVSPTTGDLELRPGRFQDLLDGLTRAIEFDRPGGISS